MEGRDALHVRAVRKRRATSWNPISKVIIPRQNIAMNGAEVDKGVLCQRQPFDSHQTTMHFRITTIQSQQTAISDHIPACPRRIIPVSDQHLMGFYPKCALVLHILAQSSQITTVDRAGFKGVVSPVRCRQAGGVRANSLECRHFVKTCCAAGRQRLVRSELEPPPPIIPSRAYCALAPLCSAITGACTLPSVRETRDRDAIWLGIGLSLSRAKVPCGFEFRERWERIQRPRTLICAVQSAGRF